MKIAVFSDIHDNLARWQETAAIIKAADIKIGICCGDVTSVATLENIAKSFDKLYLALGNADFKLAQSPGLIPENVKWFSEIGAFELEKKKISICHSPNLAREIAVEKDYDVVFYGHTHTPWEKTVENTVLLNPGEIAGQYGPASFCIYDLEKMTGSLKILR